MVCHCIPIYRPATIVTLWEGVDGGSGERGSKVEEIVLDAIVSKRHPTPQPTTVFDPLEGVDKVNGDR